MLRHSNELLSRHDLLGDPPKKVFTVVNGDKAKGINVCMNDSFSTLGLQARIISTELKSINRSETDYNTWTKLSTK